MNDQDFYNSLTDIEKGIIKFYERAEILAIIDGEQILEIGSGWGLFTRSVLMASKGTHVHTIDKIPEPRSFAKHTAGFEKRITRYIGDSKDILKKFDDDSFSVIFIDGDHGYDGFMSDFKHAWRIVRNGGTIFLDDVWHRKNFENDYGILKALSELGLQLGFTIRIYPVAHGIGVIEVNK